MGQPLLAPAFGVLLLAWIGLLDAPAQGIAPAAVDERADAALIADLVMANHILADQGVLDGYGHVSVRHDKNPNRFLIARSGPPGLVKAEDIVTLDLAAKPVAGGSGPKERFIHSEIYKVRPDVKAIIHSHASEIIPFGVAGRPLRPITGVTAFLGAGTPIFEIRETAGTATDLLIDEPARGAALARTLGGATVVLMRGHGQAVVGGSIPEVVFRGIFTSIAARQDLEASRLGTVNYLTPGEIAAAQQGNRGGLTKSWEIWKHQLMSRKP